MILAPLEAPHPNPKQVLLDAAPAPFLRSARVSRRASAALLREARRAGRPL